MIALDQTYEFDQGSVAYGSIGNGPPVVLVHGTPWSSFTWHHLAPKLAQSHTVYCYDLIGYGQSKKRDNQTVSLDVQGKLLSELIGYWGLQNPSMVAHDFGGAISLRAHLLHDMDYTKLCLMNVVAMSPWGSPFFAHVKEHEAAFAGVPAYIHKAIVETYIKGALHFDIGPKNLDALVTPWLTETGQPAFYRQIAQASQSYTDEIEPLYDRVRCPVRILWGEQDTWIPIETGRRLHTAMPGSEFIPVPNAGHLVQLEQPEIVTKKVLEFLA